MQAPALSFNRDGVLRLFYRQPISKNWLVVASTVWTGSGWSKPEALLSSEGRIDQRIALADVGGTHACLLSGGIGAQRHLRRAFTIGPACRARAGSSRPARHPRNRRRRARPATCSTAINSCGAICIAIPISPRTAVSTTARCSTPCATRSTPPDSTSSASPITPATCRAATILADPADDRPAL